MSVLYTQNFDALSVAATLPEFVGSGSATWAVSNTGAVSGANAYRNGHAGDGDYVLLDGTGAPATVADAVWQYTTTILTGGSSGYACGTPMYRFNAGYTSGYLMLLTGTVGGNMSAQLLSRAGASYTQRDVTKSLGLTFAANDKINVKVRYIGGAHALKVWLVGSSEPAAYTCIFADTTILTAGYAGVYQSTNGGAISVSFDDALLSTATVDIAADDAAILYAAPVVKASGKATGITSGRVLDVNVRESDIVQLVFDTSNTPVADIQYRIDNGPLTRATGVSSVVALTHPYASPASKNQTCRVRVWANVFEGSTTPTTLWSGAVGGWILQAIRLAEGGSLVAPTPKPTIEFLGDSITASVRRLYTGSTTNQTVMSAGDHWPELVADDLGMTPVVRGFGAVGLETQGNGGVPRSVLNFPYVYSTNAYTPAVQPVAVVIHLGTNAPATQADYQEILTAVRAARPNARIAFLAPPGKGLYATILAAVAAVGDAKTSVYDLDSNMGSVSLISEDYVDNIGHLSTGGSMKQAQLVVGFLKPILDADRVPVASDVKNGVAYNFGTVGSYTPAYTAAANVRAGTNRGDGTLGTLAVPIAANVRSGTAVDATTGTLAVPSAGNVRSGVAVDAGTGTLTLPSIANVLSGVAFGAGGNEFIGSYVAATPNYPTVGQVLSGVVYGGGTGTLALPSVGNVVSGTQFGAGGTQYTGTYTPPSPSYPPLNTVKAGTVYGLGTGTLVLPIAANVRAGIGYSDTTGTLVVPSASDVNLGVVFDNGTVGSAVGGGGTVVLDPTTPTTGNLDDIDRGASYACTITIANPSGVTGLWLTVKQEAFIVGRLDSSSEFQLKMGLGLTYLNRDVASDSSLGSVVRNGAQLTVRLSPAATAQLRPGPFVFDVKVDRSGVEEYIHSGSVLVNATITRAI